MEMAGKIACFVVLCMVIAAPHAESLTCGQVVGNLASCINYLTKNVPLGGCCSGVRALANAAKTTRDRKTACNCLKSVARTIRRINYGKAARLPGTCRVRIPYKISPTTDCSKIR